MRTVCRCIAAAQILQRASWTAKPVAEVRGCRRRNRELRSIGNLLVSASQRISTGASFLAVATESARVALKRGVAMQSASRENESIKIAAPENRSRVNATLTTAFMMCPLLR